MFFVYLLWAFVPDSVSQSLGIFYYPDKYWALAVPVWLFTLGLYIPWAYEGVNLLSVKNVDSEDLIQELGGSMPVREGWRNKNGNGNGEKSFGSKSGNINDDLPGSVPIIHDVPLEEANRVLYLTRGGDRRVRKRRVT